MNPEDYRSDFAETMRQYMETIGLVISLLPYEIEFDGPLTATEVNEVREWCAQQCGPQMIHRHPNSVESYHTATINREAKWCLVQGKYRFKDEKDAILFKLTWC